MSEAVNSQINKSTYSIGDAVIYRAEGICDIADIRREAFAGGAPADYYILSPRNDPNSVVYVPVENEKLTSMMRKILNEQEIRALIAEVRSERVEWIPDSRARNVRYRDILSVGDRRDLIVLLTSIREYIAENEKRGKKLGTTDTGALYRACRLLREEFAPAIPLDSDEALYDLIDSI